MVVSTIKHPEKDFCPPARRRLLFKPIFPAPVLSECWSHVCFDAFFLISLKYTFKAKTLTAQQSFGIRGHVGCPVLISFLPPSSPLPWPQSLAGTAGPATQESPCSPAPRSLTVTQPHALGRSRVQPRCLCGLCPRPPSPSALLVHPTAALPEPNSLSCGRHFQGPIRHHTGGTPNGVLKGNFVLAAKTPLAPRVQFLGAFSRRSLRPLLPAQMPP